jgi:3-oxoacyl-[acyl-carrier-protein] synthase II
MRRIVVTGTGLVSPLGCGTELVWQRIVAGRSGIRRLNDNLVHDVAAKIAGVVPTAEEDDEGGFDPTRAVNAKDHLRMDRFIQFAMGAAHQAIQQAAWVPDTDATMNRTATIIGSGIGGFATMKQAVHTTDQRGPRKLSPFTVPSFLVNLAAGQISIHHNFRGAIGAPVTACAASLQAIGDGARLIASGEADVAVCGGAESCIERVSLGSFAAARALSVHFNDTPERASRPFDKDRDGFVMSEGAAVLVIEELNHALAEVVGYGTTSDAYHMAAAPPGGEGLQRCMRLAIDAAGVAPEEIGYVNAHATSTPLGDVAELNAIHKVFNGARPAISSTKSSTGHLLGAAGATAAILTVKALDTGTLPPNLNLEESDIADGANLIGQTARRQAIDYAMVNGFGFGGVNATAILKRWAN